MSQNLGTIYAEIGLDTKQMKKGFRDSKRLINKETSKIERKMKSVSRNMTKIGAGMTAAITAPMVMIAKKMFDAASDAEQVQSRYEIVFGNLTNEANKFVDRMGKMGWNETGIQDDLSNFQKMLKSMGLETDNAFEMSKAMSQLTIDIASFEDISKDVAQQKIVSGVIAGEVEPLRKLGYSLTQTRVKREAVKKGIIEEGKAMTEKQKIMTRMMLLMGDAESSQNDFKRTIDQTANQVKILKEQWQKFKELYGEQIEDAFRPLVVSAKELLIWLNDLDEDTRIWIMRIAALVGVVGPVVLILGQFINSLFIIKGLMVTISGSAVIGKLIAGIKGLAALLGGGFATSIGIAVAGVLALLGVFTNFIGMRDALFKFVKNLGLLIFDLGKGFKITGQAIVALFKGNMEEMEKLNNKSEKLLDDMLKHAKGATLGTAKEIKDGWNEQWNGMKEPDFSGGKIVDLRTGEEKDMTGSADGFFDYQKQIEEAQRKMRETTQLAAEKTKEIVGGATEGTDSILNNATSGLEMFREQLATKAEMINGLMNNIKTSMTSSISQGLTDIVDGTKSAGDAIRSTFIDIIGSLKNMIIKFLAKKAVITFMNFLTGGTGGTIASAVGSALGVFHDGGQVPGYNNQDVPIIAQAGEYVLQPEQLNSLLTQAGQTNNNQNSYTINVGDINNYGEEKVSDQVVNEIMRKLRMNEMSTGRLV